MAKFNIEVDLDWLDEDEHLDEVLKEAVISGIQDRLTKNVEREVEKQLAENITKKVEVAVDEFLQKITSDKIENIIIPHKTSSWGSEVEMIPISEFIGQKFESMATDKVLDGSGQKYDRYNSRDGGPYSMIEYLTKGYIAKELNEKVIKMIQQAKSQAEQTLINSLEENLQQQLNADMLQRLNIPALLESLQNTILVEGENK